MYRYERHDPTMPHSNLEYVPRRRISVNGCLSELVTNAYRHERPAGSPLVVTRPYRLHFRYFVHVLAR